MVCAMLALASALVIGQEPAAPLWPPPCAEDGLWAESLPTPGRPFARSSQRCLVAGLEGGPLEVWAYPFQIARNVRFTVRLADGTRLAPEEHVAHVGASPDAVCEHYELGVAGALLRTVSASPAEPAALIEFRASGLTGATLEMTLDPSLRLVWPASSAGVVPDMENRANDFAIIGNTNADGPQLWGAVTASQPLRPLRREGFEHAYSAALPADQPLRLVFAGSEEKWSRASDLAAETLRFPDLAAREAEKRRDAVLGPCAIATGDAEVDEAARWAKVGLASLVVEAPNVGRGFVGALGPQGHRCSPGFAQFETEALLSACRAANAVGLLDASVASLDLMREHQARDGAGTGLPPAQVSPAHRYVGEEARGYLYEGVDCTAAYVMAVWRAWRWSGDDGLVRKHGEALRRAAERLGEDDADAISALVEMADLAGLANRLDDGPVARRAAHSAKPEPHRALEAFRSGNPDDGWRLLRAVARERLGGVFGGLSDEAPSETLCSAASSAAFLVTLTEGLLGLEPDAPNDALTLRPSLPDGMDRVSVRGLHVGEHIVDIEIVAGEGVTVRHEGRDPLTVTLVADAGATTVEVKDEAEIEYR